MSKLTITIPALLLLFIASTISDANSAPQIQIYKNGSSPSAKAPATNFTGDVRVEMLFPKGRESNLSSGIVTFEPKARTNWHSHPSGQALYILSGVGQVQQWGSNIEEVRAGDVVWFPANIKHWHGASETNAMSHLSIAPINNGKSSDWMEKVTDNQFNSKKN